MLVHALGDGHGMRARVDAGQDVHVLGIEQPLRLVDGHVGLGLRVRVDAHDLVLAQHAALVVGPVDGELGASIVEERPRGGEGPAEVEDQADLDGLLLALDFREEADEQTDGQRHRKRQGNAE